MFEEPLAVFSHVEPADDQYINRKGMMKMTYKYGQLLIPKSNIGIYGVSPSKKRVFVDYYDYWPDFGISERKEYDLIDRINIMFEIDLSDLAFRDLYIFKESYQDIKPTGFDFSGLEGYRRYIGINSWYYVAVNPRVMAPQGTPLTISCSNIGYKNNISLAGGDWQEFYNKVITLISQFRQQDAKGKIQ